MFEATWWLVKANKSLFATVGDDEENLKEMFKQPTDFWLNLDKSDRSASSKTQAVAIDQYEKLQVRFMQMRDLVADLQDHGPTEDTAVAAASPEAKAPDAEAPKTEAPKTDAPKTDASDADGVEPSTVEAAKDTA